jgi:hypothetical protein
MQSLWYGTCKTIDRPTRFDGGSATTAPAAPLVRGPASAVARSTPPCGGVATSVNAHRDTRGVASAAPALAASQFYAMSWNQPLAGDAGLPVSEDELDRLLSQPDVRAGSRSDAASDDSQSTVAMDDEFLALFPAAFGGTVLARSVARSAPFCFQIASLAFGFLRSASFRFVVSHHAHAGDSQQARCRRLHRCRCRRTPARRDSPTWRSTTTERSARPKRPNLTVCVFQRVAHCLFSTTNLISLCFCVTSCAFDLNK